MKYSVYLHFVLLAFLSTTESFSQDFSISGSIEDDHGQPVAFAHVILKRAKDSVVVKGVSSDENGFFKFEKLLPEAYLIKFGFMGYSEVYKSISVDKSVNLGTIIMTEASEALDEISIMAKRPTLKKMADRLVFNIENTPLVEGNMFEVIKNTPGVLVLDTNIQVKNTTPTVFINDRKVHLTGDELIKLLESASANTIKSVEVITNPSAKYDAESGAVINIKMGKNLITGYSGNVFANYTQGVFPKYDGGMSHFFKNEKIDFFANYTYSDKKINRDDHATINYLDAAQQIDQIWKSDVNRNTWTKTHNFNFNFDYTIDERNSLSLSSVMLWLPYFKYKIFNTTQVFDPNQQRISYYDTNNHSNDDKYNLGFDIDFTHHFKNPGEKLTFNGHFTTYDYQRDQEVLSHYFFTDGTFDKNSAYRTDNNQNTKILTAQTDYTLPLNETSTLESGIKFSDIDTKSSIAQFNIDQGIEILDVDNSDAFDYEESIFAAYINYMAEWGAFSLTTGLRAEQTQLRGISLANTDVSKTDYLEWFPSASIEYTLSDQVSLYSNYKRSITRPDYASLNPFRFFLNDNTIVTGNPNLRPLISDHIELGTSLFSRFTIEAYYKTYADNIFELPIQDNSNNTLTYTPININKTEEFGFDFITYFDVMPNWSTYFVTSFYNTNDKGVFGTDFISRSQWSNYSMLSNDFTFLKDQSLTANLTIIYSSKNQQGFIEVDHLLFSELSAAKSILKNKATLSLTVSDVFNGQDFRTKSQYLNQNSASLIKQDTRTIKFGFRYKFGNSTLKTNQRQKTQEETDRLLTN